MSTDGPNKYTQLKHKNAFPVNVVGGYREGIDVRTYIATMALSGILADSQIQDVGSAARVAVIAADALIKELVETK